MYTSYTSKDGRSFTKGSPVQMTGAKKSSTMYIAGVQVLHVASAVRYVNYRGPGVNVVSVVHQATRAVVLSDLDGRYGTAAAASSTWGTPTDPQNPSKDGRSFMYRSSVLGRAKKSSTMYTVLLLDEDNSSPVVRMDGRSIKISTQQNAAVRGITSIPIPQIASNRFSLWFVDKNSSFFTCATARETSHQDSSRWDPPDPESGIPHWRCKKQSHPR